ncbi:MAG: nuclear transport factor 2 family protein [Gemmataceae bacterium]|nr:nuclear transport factor 2 family protein [Gemmataceae bacterium]
MTQRAYLFLVGAVLFGWAMYEVGAACPRRHRLVAQPVAQRVAQQAVQPAAQQQPAAKTAAAQAADAAADAAREAVLANVRAFTDAFNRRDVMALLKLFAEDCELTESDGTTLHGLTELEEALKDSFEADPDSRISVSVDSLRMVTPDVVLEEGKTTFFPDGKTLTAETDYQATHVKKGDRWLMSRVRSFNRVVLSPYDHLRDLEWLVGDWVDEGPDSLVEASYRWDANKAFLLQDFSIRIKGENVLSGTQRIGRDPLSNHIKAWVFDSEGGYAESLWSNVDDTWVIKMKGVRSDGTVVMSTNQLTQLAKDRILFESVDRLVGEERMPSLSVIVVRKPPQAKR